MSEKGDIIANSDISCAKQKITNKDYSNTTCSARLKAIDRQAATLSVYLDKTVDIEDLALKLYDGWGKTILELPFVDAEYKTDYNFYKLCNNEGRKCLNYKERENLCNIYDNKKTITICKTILIQNGYGDIFLDELKKSLREDKKLIKSKNIYKELSGLNGIFITTNIDEHFDKFLIKHE